MLKSRKGIVDSELIQLILAVALVALAIFIAVKLISPSNQTYETSDAYLSSIQNSIKEAEKFGNSEFVITPSSNDSSFYVVYFGDKLRYFEEKTGLNFTKNIDEKNSLCVCSVSNGFSVCNSCVSLDKPVQGLVNGETNLENFVFNIIPSQKLLIKNEESSYIFEADFEELKTPINSLGPDSDYVLETFEQLSEEEEALVSYEEIEGNDPPIKSYDLIKTTGACPGIVLAKIPDDIKCTATISTCNVVPELLDKLLDANELAKDRGKELVVTAGYRSYEAQKILRENYEDCLIRYGKSACRNKEAALPSCEAPHQTGKAVDVHLFDSSGNHYPLELQSLMTSLDFVRYEKEHWHFECCGTKRYSSAKELGVDVLS